MLGPFGLLWSETPLALGTAVDEAKGPTEMVQVLLGPSRPKPSQITTVTDHRHGSISS